MRSCPTLAFVILLSVPVLAWAQAPATLRVEVPAGKSITLSASDLDAMAREKVAVADDQGKPATYEGVPVIEILKRAGAPSGKSLHGKNLTLYLMVTASDGYHAVYALAELDPGFKDRAVLLADKRDGKDLSSVEGSFRIIAPDDKRHARWVRHVTSLSVKSAPAN